MKNALFNGYLKSRSQVYKMVMEKFWSSKILKFSHSRTFLILRDFGEPLSRDFIGFHGNTPIILIILIIPILPIGCRHFRDSGAPFSTTILTTENTEDTEIKQASANYGEYVRSNSLPIMYSLSVLGFSSVVNLFSWLPSIIMSPVPGLSLKLFFFSIILSPVPGFWGHSLFTIHQSPITNHHSPFTIHHSPFVPTYIGDFVN